MFAFDRQYYKRRNMQLADMSPIWTEREYIEIFRTFAAKRDWDAQQTFNCSLFLWSTSFSNSIFELYFLLLFWRDEIVGNNRINCGWIWIDSLVAFVLSQQINLYPNSRSSSWWACKSLPESWRANITPGMQWWGVSRKYWSRTKNYIDVLWDTH